MAFYDFSESRIKHSGQCRVKFNLLAGLKTIGFRAQKIPSFYLFTVIPTKLSLSTSKNNIFLISITTKWCILLQLNTQQYIKNRLVNFGINRNPFLRMSVCEELNDIWVSLLLEWSGCEKKTRFFKGFIRLLVETFWFGNNRWFS